MIRFSFLEETVFIQRSHYARDNPMRCETTDLESVNPMKLGPLSSLLLCLVCIVLTGLGRFASGSALPRPLMDVLFIASVLAGLMASIYIVVKHLSSHAAEAIDEIEEQGRGPIDPRR